jgi:hypothetical protein
MACLSEVLVARTDITAPPSAGVFSGKAISATSDVATNPLELAADNINIVTTNRDEIM